MFLTAMAVFLFEVALTRVFAILMWHHFAYMVVSLALLGFGASLIESKYSRAPSTVTSSCVPGLHLGPIVPTSVTFPSWS